MQILPATQWCTTRRLTSGGCHPRDVAMVRRVVRANSSNGKEVAAPPRSESKGLVMSRANGRPVPVGHQLMYIPNLDSHQSSSSTRPVVVPRPPKGGARAVTGLERAVNGSQAFFLAQPELLMHSAKMAGLVHVLTQKDLELQEQKMKLQALERANKAMKSELMQSRAAMSDARGQLALKDAEVVSLRVELAERDVQLATALAQRLVVEDMLQGLAASALALGEFGLGESEVSGFGESEGVTGSNVRCSAPAGAEGR